MPTLSQSEIRLDEREVQKVLDTLALVPGAAARASARASNKSITRVRRQVLRQLSVHNQLPQKAFKGRVFLRRANRNRAQASVWFGVRPIVASAIGPLRKTRNGYSVRGRVFKSAFEATMPSGHSDVFMRASDGYVSKRGSKGWTKGRPRTSSRNLPIVKPSVAIDLGTDIALNNFRTDYIKTLGQEANYELQKALGRISK